MNWRALIVWLVLAGPGIASAQSMSGMDHAAMGHGDVPASTPAQDEHAQPAHADAHDDAPMSMGAMQGGAAPANARSPDWSDGVVPSSMEGMTMMDMDDRSSVANLLLDNLESFAGKGSHGQSWEADGWYGNDTDKLWLRSEGERTGNRPQDGDVEAFWNHAVAAFWDTQLGVRRDFGEGPARTWAAAGIQGLAPYWFEVEATLYAGAGGRTAARARVEYELRLTQRLILQPELEINAYGKADPLRDIGAGLSSVDGGLRLRYEIRRSFAPYVGVTWEHLTGGTADLAKDAGRRITDRRWVAGIRLWF
ncbi:copper resistance protein B [Luteibacter flocculans]|nr:copper resistance protein B [Luteibacter flocculans]